MRMECCYWRQLSGTSQHCLDWWTESGNVRYLRSNSQSIFEVQMLVCVSVTLATTVLDLWRTSEGLLKASEGLPKDFGLYGLQNLLVYKSQPPGLQELFKYEIMREKISYPDSGLGEVGPHGDLLPGWHVWVSVASKQRLQLLELLGGEVSSLSSLSLLLAILVQTVIVTVTNLAALTGSLAWIWNIWMLKLNLETWWCCWWQISFNLYK